MKVDPHARIMVAPEMIRGTAFCPYRRGDEYWWGDGTLFVRGLIPQGAIYKHNEAHELAADWGPVGDPTQVEPALVEGDGTIRLHDQFGSFVTKMERRVFDLFSELFGGFLIFAYPEVQEGMPQLLAIFRRSVYHVHPMLEMMGIDPNDPELPKDGDVRIDLAAFCTPVGSNVKYFLTIEERDALPRFGGAELEAEED